MMSSDRGKYHDTVIDSLSFMSLEITSKVPILVHMSTTPYDWTFCYL